MAPARKYWRYVRQIYDRSDSTSRVACYIRAAARNSIQPRCLCLINYYGQYANRMQIARHRARCASRVGGEKSTKERKRRKRKRRRKKERERERREDLNRKFGVNRSALALISLFATKKVFRPPYPSGRLRIQGRTSPPREGWSSYDTGSEWTSR